MIDILLYFVVYIKPNIIYIIINASKSSVLENDIYVDADCFILFIINIGWFSKLQHKIALKAKSE